jgi:hypothetical protein
VEQREWGHVIQSVSLGELERRVLRDRLVDVDQLRRHDSYAGSELLLRGFGVQ